MASEKRTLRSMAPRPAEPKTPEPAAASPAARRRSAVESAAGSNAETVQTTKPVKRRRSPVIPYLTVRDPLASLAFYEQAFGFKRGETLFLPDGRLVQVGMHHAGVAVFRFSPEGIWSGSMQAPVSSGMENPIVLYVPCRKVDDLAEQARAAGATIVTAPENMFWGERIARIVDPDGYLWCFAARAGKFDPLKIPEVAEGQQLPGSEPQQNQADEPKPQGVQSSDLDFEF